MGVVLGLAAPVSHYQSKNVNVAVRAKWAGTSILLEASELLAKERKDFFWQFLELQIAAAHPHQGAATGEQEQVFTATDQECVHQIVEQGSSLLGPSLSPLFRLSLSLRSASPKVLLYQQLAQESLAAAAPHNNFLSHTTTTPNSESVPNEEETDPQHFTPKPYVADRWSISKSPVAPNGGTGSFCCWVDTSSGILLQESELLDWLKLIKKRSPDVDKKQQPEIFEFDHIYPSGSEDADFSAVLYGSYGVPCFARFHSLLVAASKQGEIVYVVRPVLPTGCKSKVDTCARVGVDQPVNLGGFGVELALKNMEYKAIDDSEVKKGDIGDETLSEDLGEEVRGFIFSKLLERKPELAGELLTFRDHLLSAGVAETMNVWELKDLGYQTAQRIIRASEPLKLMQEINQNFPNLVSSLSRMQVNETIKDEIVSNQQMLPPGKNLVAINGAVINLETVDIFSLIDLVQGELSLASSITSLKIPQRVVRQFLQLPEPSEQGGTRLDFRSTEHVHYLNNIEEDQKYKRWRTNLNELLMPVFPGQMRSIRKNLFHAIYIVDPASPDGLLALENMFYLHSSNVPIRFGVILLSTKALEQNEAFKENSLIEDGSEEREAGIDVNDRQDLSTLVIRLFLQVKEDYGLESAFSLLNSLRVAWGGEAEEENEPVEMSHVEDAFSEFMRTKGKEVSNKAMTHLEELLSGDAYKKQAVESSGFVDKLGLSKMHPCLLMNGVVYGPNQVQTAAIPAMNDELPKIQEGVYYRAISQRTDVLDFFLSENGQPRYNPQIVAAPKGERKFVDLALPIAENDQVVDRLQYLHHPGTEDDVKPVTHWLALDIRKSAGIHLLQQALHHLSSGTKKGRIGILHNSKRSESEPSLLTRIVMVATQSPRRAKVVPFLQRLLTLNKVINNLPLSQGKSEDEVVQEVVKLADEMGLRIADFKDAIASPSSRQAALDQISEEGNFLSRVFGLKPGVDAVITNGQVFIQEEGKYFVAEDFVLLETVEYDKRVKPVEELVEKIEWESVEPDDLTSEFLSTVVMAVSSSMSTRSRSSETVRFGLLKADHSAIIREVENSPIHVDAVIDPLSSAGQKITPFLVLLQDWIQPSMRIILNPMNSLADLPLKNFYRFVVPTKDVYTAEGDLTPGPFALFSNMPPSRTLTMNLDVPEPWLVESVVALHDLDNIVLEKLGNAKTMYAVYELEALVLTGHCSEPDSNEPPRGLQLLLGTNGHPHMVDTIVMANLGYWQLKAAPGVWNLALAAGRSTELYTLSGVHEGTDKGPLTRHIVIADFQGQPVRLKVVKKKGQEGEKILDSDNSQMDNIPPEGKKTEKNKFLQWASGLLGLGSKSSELKHDMNLGDGSSKIVRSGEVINIFSIASGHLYERFLKIMMLSVLKNTRRPVKFWFIKNYLSPQFKGLIPHMAQEYGFEYDLVTYKWPSWLHKQSEKQRIIWAYKILFLDVLFPLSLKKVIYVDADQIVRTDMGELYDMDIRGRPLAYTPFCDNNREMDGYRFWNQGFWRDHLQGKPYHISALYVVDLVRFRKSAAGDNLRVYYESLSKDPNSLSNLDQDLPNYAQHTVPIFSLPQQWLWCESWCGNATKAYAKTIDLCNNPMTKEPKLEGARRIVPEWVGLDEEARQFTARIESQHFIPPSSMPGSSIPVDDYRALHEEDPQVDNTIDVTETTTSSSTIRETASEL